MVAFWCSCERFTAFLRAGRQEVAHFGLFRFRLCEFCWVGRSLLGVVCLSAWEALCISFWFVARPGVAHFGLLRFFLYGSVWVWFLKIFRAPLCTISLAGGRGHCYLVVGVGSCSVVVFGCSYDKSISFRRVGRQEVAQFCSFRFGLCECCWVGWIPV